MQSSRSASLSHAIRSLLYKADRKILAMAGGSPYHLYHYLRVTAAAFARVDSFYIGFCREDRTIVFPYNYDGREYDDPNINPYQPGGMTEWIVAHRCSYWSRRDKGELLHRGRPFGDTTRRSREAITTPISGAGKGGKRPVIGVLAILSYEEGVYTEETVGALEYLAGSLAAALEREKEDAERRRWLEVPDNTPPIGHSLPRTVDALSERLGSVRRRAAAIRAMVDPDSPLCPALEELCRECEQSQTDAVELLLETVATDLQNPWQGLTLKEREVAHLLVRGKSNREIAARLFIAETTVKTHVSSVIRKLNAGGRSGVAERLRPFLPPDYSPPLEDAENPTATDVRLPHATL